MKYKLIKEYPGSPKLGCILEKKEDNNYYPINQPGGWFSEKSHLIPFSEFWEKVVEKDYEILSFKDKFSTRILKFKNNMYRDGNMYLPFDKLINNTKYWEIHSVKRLSDDEIFTIGDEVKHPLYKPSFKINHIYIQNCNPPIIWFHSLPFVHGTCTQTLDKNVILEKAIKIKQPLFTTEDGVDIFEGDLCTTVRKYNFNIGNISWKPQIDTLYQLKDHGLITFSTKEKAEEYILLNKPCLSLMEIRDLVGEHETVGRLIYKMEKLVKEKLKP